MDRTDLGTLHTGSRPLPLRMNIDVPDDFTWATATFQLVIVNTMSPRTDIAAGTIQVSEADERVEYAWADTDLAAPGSYIGQLWVEHGTGLYEPLTELVWTVETKTINPFGEAA